MKNIDKFNIGLIIICTIIYIILCYHTKYKYSLYNNYESSQTTNNENRMLYITTVYGFIYGAILISFQQRYLAQKISSLWVWILILFASIILVFSAFYSQIYNNDNPNSFMTKFSYAIVPILPSLVILSESAISEVLEHGFKEDRESEKLMASDSEMDRTDENWYVSDRSK